MTPTRAFLTWLGCGGSVLRVPMGLPLTEHERSGERLHRGFGVPRAYRGPSVLAESELRKRPAPAFVHRRPPYRVEAPCRPPSARGVPLVFAWAVSPYAVQVPCSS